MNSAQVQRDIATLVPAKSFKRITRAQQIRQFILLVGKKKQKNKPGRHGIVRNISENKCLFENIGENMIDRHFFKK